MGGRFRWWTCAAAWTALMCVLLWLGTTEWGDSIFWFAPAVGAAIGNSTVGFRARRGFWPWDFRRRKVERWRWLVETPSSEHV